MSYSIKELYLTLQGEGAHSGRVAVFVRMSGCNLWSGRDRDKETADCWFCDTDFIGTDGPGGARFRTAEELAKTISSCWEQDCGSSGTGRPYVIFTGGEPMLQLDQALIDACKGRGFEVGVESNGTLPIPRSIDWICVSPKPGPELVQCSGDELKLVFPQDVDPETVAGLDFQYFFLQPLDGPDREANTARCIEYCRSHPHWRLSLQTHKLIGIP